MDGAAVHGCTLSPDGRKQLVAHRIEHHAGLDHAVLRKGDGHRVLGNAVGEVAGAVQGIDDPQPGRHKRGPLGGFLGKEFVVGKRLPDGCHNGGLGGPVRSGHHFGGGFEIHLKRVALFEDDLSGAPGGPDGGVEYRCQVFHGGATFLLLKLY